MITHTHTHKESLNVTWSKLLAAKVQGDHAPTHQAHTSTRVVDTNTSDLHHTYTRTLSDAHFPTHTRR